jgi:hypothetical protein
VRYVGKFVRLGRSEGLGGQEIWEVREGGKLGMILSPVRNVFLKLCVDYVSLLVITAQIDLSITLLLFFMLFKCLLI